MLSLRLCSQYPDAVACSSALPPLWKGMTEDTSFTFSFLGAFSLTKTAVSALCVCWGGNDKVPGGLTMAGSGGSRGLRISPLCPWKDVKSQLFEPSRAVVGFSWGGGRERQGENQECEEDRFGNSAFLNKLQHLATCKFACSEQSPQFFSLHKFKLY